LLIFAIGFVCGATALSEIFLHFELGFRNSMGSANQEYWVDWEHRLAKAVSEEKKEVAIWAIENYVAVLEERFNEEDCDTWQTEQLALSYSQLASFSEKEGDNLARSEHIKKALSLAVTCDLGGIKREEQLLEFWKKKRWQ
jgi:hypothetical protein